MSCSYAQTIFSSYIVVGFFGSLSTEFMIDSETEVEGDSEEAQSRACSMRSISWSFTPLQSQLHSLWKDHGYRCHLLYLRILSLYQIVIGLKSVIIVVNKIRLFSAIWIYYINLCLANLIFIKCHFSSLP